MWPQFVSALCEAGVIAPGAIGPENEVLQFADAWSEQTNNGHRVGRGSRIHQLERVAWPTLPPGEMRVATTAQRALVLEWTEKFVRESIPEEVIPIDELLVAAEQRLHDGETFLWFAAERPTCMAYHTGPTPNGVRISGVYTPEPDRGNGFATALVATLSQRLLDAGRRACFIYTDADNPTSNRIYRRIGYRHVCDCRHVLFET